MQNRDVAHRFFYDYSGSFDRRSMTVSYGNNKYLSYGTVIGKITEDTEGNTICIISDNNFSNTTAKHIGELRSACPYPVYYLPQEMYNHDFYINTTIDKLKNRLEWAASSKLTQKSNREYFTHAYYMLTKTLEIVDFQERREDIENILKEHKELYDTLIDDTATAELKKKLKKREAEKQAQLKKELETIFNQYSYLDIVKFTFSDYWFNDTSVEEYNKQKELKTKLRKYLNPHNDLSFVWFDNDTVKTSQHITVDRREAETLLKLWQHNKLKHGMTISCYTVLEVMENYVKIGCHKIPVENLQALLNEISLSKVA